MANVSFLRGTQSKLDTLLKNGSGYTEGAFYLTTDSDRLYFAQSANELVHLNHNVIQVASVAALPAVATAVEGDFYYAKAENVLCTKVGTSWMQINKDTNDDTYVAGIDDMKVESTAEGGITISFDIKQNKKNVAGDEQALTDIPVSFNISRSDLATANNIDVGVATSAVTNGVKIATVGDGSSGAGFNLTATGNAKLTRDTTGNVNITALDTTYDLGASNNQITLYNNLTTDVDFIDVSSGNDAITVVAANDDLTITHKAYTTTPTTSSVEPESTKTFTAIDSLTIDKGHVTGYNTKTIKMPEEITSTLSALDNNGAQTIRLTESNGDTSDVILADGETNDIEIATSGNTITIDHKTYNAPKVTPVTGVEPAAEETFTVVDSIVTNNGHITEYKTKTVKMPHDTINVSTNINADNQGKLTVSVTDSKGDTVSKTSGQVLYFTVGDGDNKKTVYNQGDLDVYTKDEIDGKIEAVNAMTYKGTVGENGTVTVLPSTGVKIGDTYKVVKVGNYGGHSCDVGDLLIALGTEVDGVITSGLTWTYVPSGDDVDSQYELNVANNTISLKNTVTKDVVGSATVKGSDYIEVATSGTDITISHKDGYLTKAAQSTAATVAPDYTQSFTVVDSITTDNGHVSAFNTKTVTLPAAIVSELSATGNQIVLDESNNDKYAIDLAGDNAYITLTAANNKITAAHKKDYGTLTPTVGTALKPDAEGKFTIVTAMTRDSGGHLTGYTTQEVTLPHDTTSAISAVDNKIHLTESNGDSSDVTIAGDGTYISVATTANTNTIKASHKTYGTLTATSGAALEPEPETTFNVVTGISRDSGGHLSGYTVQSVKLPHDTNIDKVETSVANVGADKKKTSFTTTITETTNDAYASTVTLASTSLQVEKDTTATNIINIDLVWGSF